MPYGNTPFGLREVVLEDAAGNQVALPASRVIAFQERLVTAELMDDAGVISATSYTDAMEWSLEAGGISLEAYAIMTGRTATEAGTTPTRTNTLGITKGEYMPWFKVYGRALGDGEDDLHVLADYVKLTGAPQGSFSHGEFLVTSMNGVAVGDPANGDLIFQFVQHETAEQLAPFSPDSIDGLVRWIKADGSPYQADNTTPCVDTDQIYYLRDLSPAGVDFSEGTGNRPQFLDPEPNHGSIPGIDGNNSNTTVMVFDTPLSNLSAFTVFFAYYKEGTVQGGSVITNGSRSSAASIFINNDTSFRISSNSTYNVLVTCDTAPANDLGVNTIMFDGSTLTAWANDGQDETTNGSFSGDAFTFSILFNEQTDGSGAAFNGQLYQMLIYNVTLTADQRAQVWEYLNNEGGYW